MKFTLVHAWDLLKEEAEEIEINSLEDLKEIQRRYCEHFPDTKYVGSFKEPDLIIDFREMTITIYDDYME